MDPTLLGLTYQSSKVDLPFGSCQGPGKSKAYAWSQAPAPLVVAVGEESGPRCLLGFYLEAHGPG